jgi:hypothetical protein
MFEQWSARFPTANGSLTAAVKALVEGHRAFVDQQRKASTDETATPGARLVRSAKAARSKLIPLIEQIEIASAEAAEAAAHLEAKTAEAYNPSDKKYETCMRHAEIREFFKTLPQGRKMQLIEEARKANDHDTLIALASCQPFLSGLDQQAHQYVRGQLIEAYAPREAAALASIREQQDLSIKLRDTMVQSVGDMIDFAKADELISAASDELAA